MSVYYNFIKWIVVGYLGFMLLFYLVSPDYYPSSSHALFQAGEALLVLTFAYFLLREEVKIPFLTMGITLYLIILIGSYRFFNYFYFDDWLGVGVDGRYYTRIATEFSSSNYPLSYLFDYLQQKHIMLDDYGMFSITSVIFWLLGSEVGFHVLPFLSIVPIVIGGYLLMKICEMYVVESDSAPKFLYFLWGIMTFAAYDCSVSLKENYMVGLIITAVYFLCRCTSRLSLSNIFFFSLFALGQLLFRTAICYMLFASLVAIIAMKFEIFGKRVTFWVILACIVSIPLFSMLIDYIGGERGNVNGDFVKNIYDQKMASGGFVAPILNVVATLIGPIPSFVNEPIKVKYMTLFSFTSMVKLFLSFGYLYSIYYAFKHKILGIIPIVIYVILHSLMIWSIFYSLHDRYQWPQYPFVLFLSLYGLEKLRQDYPYMFLYKYYCVFASLCVIVFNLRFT